MSSTETTPVTVTINDARAAGLCTRGGRLWAERHGLDWRAFLEHGISAEALLATGDAMALRAVAQAERRTRKQGQS